MEVSEKKRHSTTAKQETNFDYSKSEVEIKTITIPNSQFQAKWKKDEGYAIGYEGYKLTKDHETLEGALNQIGYGVNQDKDGDEILVKHGEIDFELIVRLIKIMLVINNENHGKNDN